MRAGGSKQKGAHFEREVCKLLSLWVSHGMKQDLFWRSAMSGGRATVARKSGIKLNRQAGDICSVSPEGHALTDEFYIECKFYKNLRLQNFLFGYGPLHEFWVRTRAEARSHSRDPMLIAKQNNVPTLVLTRANTLDAITSPSAKGDTIVRGSTYDLRVLEEVLRSDFRW